MAEYKKLAKQKKIADRRRRQHKIMKMKAEIERKKLEEEEDKKSNRVTTENPVTLIQDEMGKIRDEKGNVLNLQANATYKLKVNINKSKKELIKKMFNATKSNITTLKNTPFYDSSIRTGHFTNLKKRKRNTAFQFIEKGSISLKAEQIRKHVSLEED